MIYKGSFWRRLTRKQKLKLLRQKAHVKTATIQKTDVNSSNVKIAANSDIDSIKQKQFERV